MKDRRKTILIAGYYGYGNYGDDVILKSLIDSIRHQDSEVDVVVVSREPGVTQKAYDVRSIPEDAFDLIVNEIQQSSLVLLGGGGLFHDYWPIEESRMLSPGHSGLGFYADVAMLAHLAGTPLKIHAVGVGPLRSEQAKEWTRTVFRLADGSSVRDIQSLETLIEIGLTDGEDVELPAVTVDPGFLIETPVDNRASDQHPEKTNQTIAVSLRYWDFTVEPADWESAVADALDQLIDELGVNVRMIPAQLRSANVYEDDFEVCSRVKQRMRHPGKVTLIDSPVGFDTIRNLLVSADLVLAMRYHIVLASILAEKPVVGMAYDPKVSNLMDMAGLAKDTIPLESLTGAKLLRHLKHVIRRQPSVSKKRIEEWQLTAQADIDSLSLLRAGTRHENADVKVRKLTLARLNSAYAQISSIESTQSRTEGELADRELELKQARAEIDQLRTTYRLEMKSVKQSLADRDRELRETTKKLRFETEAAKVLRLERDDFRSQLMRLRSTVGVRLLDRYWQMLHRLAPPGSRLKAFYVRIRRDGTRERLMAFDAKQIGNLALHSEVVDSFTGIGETWTQFESLLDELEAVPGREGVKTFLIAAPTGLESSEGQRSSNFALELARRGIPVVFAYWRWDREPDWIPAGPHKNIVQLPIDVLMRDPDQVFARFPGRERIALFEFPFNGLFESVASADGHGWTTCYDIVDDWEAFQRVGQADWYDSAFEQYLISHADAIFAVNGHVASNVKNQRGRVPALVSNGVDLAIFSPKPTNRLDSRQIRIGYFGYLADSWFDWTLIDKLARRNPAWHIQLIGYGDPRRRSLAPNIELFGRVPQSKLPLLTAEWKVGLVPFKEGAVAKNADPIKIYEYLALGLPVVTATVSTPPGTEKFVVRSRNPDEFEKNVALAIESAFDPIEVAQVVQNMSWSHRVDQLLAALSATEIAYSEKRMLFNV